MDKVGQLTFRSETCASESVGAKVRLVPAQTCVGSFTLVSCAAGQAGTEVSFQSLLARRAISTNASASAAGAAWMKRIEGFAVMPPKMPAMITQVRKKT